MARRLKANDFGEAAVRADDLLDNIRAAREIIDDLEREYLEVAARLKAEYETRLKPFREELAGDEKALLALMKACRDALFDGTDVVYLSNGTLVHSRKDKVSIPRNHDAVIALCEEHGFVDAVKIVKSLDREAIEKWPDERLFLIGAERKTREEFSYDLKKEPAK
jgi:phage host-nuclease inhibitor protein Gam